MRVCAPPAPPRQRNPETSLDLTTNNNTKTGVALPRVLSAPKQQTKIGRRGATARPASLSRRELHWELAGAAGARRVRPRPWSAGGPRARHARPRHVVARLVQLLPQALARIAELVARQLRQRHGGAAAHLLPRRGYLRAGSHPVPALGAPVCAGAAIATKLSALARALEHVPPGLHSLLRNE